MYDKANAVAAPGRSRGDYRTMLTRVGERSGSLWTAGILVLILIGFTATTPHFLSQANWVATSLATTEILLLALGETILMTTGGIDLSVGANLAVSSMAAAWVMSRFEADMPGDASLALGFATGIGVGLLMGLANGLVITRLGVAPLIATLGTLGVATGLADVIGNGAEISNLPAGISTIGTSNPTGWLPVPVMVTVVITLIFWALLAKLKFGRWVTAIGSNTESARRVGIPVDRILLRAYLLCGLLGGVAGLLVISRFDVASPTNGLTDNLNAIAAVVIGGTSLFGGRGTIGGTVVGALIISILTTGLILANLNSFWQEIVVGVILIGAVFLDQQRIRLTNLASAELTRASLRQEAEAAVSAPATTSGAAVGPEEAMADYQAGTGRLESPRR